MATVVEVQRAKPGVMTARELAEQFGAIPLERIVFDPLPGTATLEDAERINERRKPYVELVDGVLVEKLTGALEGILAGYLVHLLWDYLEKTDIGIAGGDGTMLRILPDQVRIPDAAFIAWDKLPGRRFPRKKVPGLVPDLAVEVLSEDNTREEMDRKLHDYFASVVRLVWYIEPIRRTVDAYTGPAAKSVFTEDDVLDGGDVLPGLAIELRSFFHQIELEDEA